MTFILGCAVDWHTLILPLYLLTNIIIMASNIYGRYIWLIDTIRQHNGVTYEEINTLWMNSGLSYGESNPLAHRTFHNHLNAIRDIFDINIKCDLKNGYKYSIENLEKLKTNQFRNWLIDSYATLNQLHADQKLEHRIQFENIPTGHVFLTVFLEAMRKNEVLTITHQGFGKESANTFEIEPYYVKLFNRRWYLIARSPYLNDIRIYGLDRITNVVSSTNKTFEMPTDFDIDEYFEGCCGIIADKSIPIEKVIIKTYSYARHYLATLQLHPSQKEIASDKESTTYEFHVRPTFDFLQSILAQADRIKVLEPKSVRTRMKQVAENLLSFYKND